ncbi:hypothetical protein C5167_030213 [Papaver somniferum]|nr:hypothetical protein C5167_030213 [Papaver somniferum]
MDSSGISLCMKKKIKPKSGAKTNNRGNGIMVDTNCLIQLLLRLSVWPTPQSCSRWYICLE